jgi:hypothetical protein
MKNLDQHSLVTKIKKYSIENIFFIFLLIYSVALIWKYDFYLTLDGPAHIYNSGLLNLFDSSDFLKQYFEKNTLLLPNYTDHIIFQYLLKFFDGFYAHKIFLSLIIIFLPISFRHAVRSVSNNTSNFHFIIFPLLFNSLLHYGFYNFNLAFIFLNVQVILTTLVINRTKGYYLFLILIILNSVVLFYTHAFVFGISLIISFSLLLIKEFKNLKKLFLKGLIFFLLFAPSLILFYLFNEKIEILNYDYDMSNYEKFKNILFFSPAIVYITELEAPSAGLLAILSIILTTFLVIKKSESRELFNLSDVFLIFSIIVLPILMFTKNGFLSGMFSVRLLLLFYYFLFFWIASNPIKNKVIMLISFFIISFTFINLAEIRHPILSEQSKDVAETVNASKYIKDRSVVFPINLLESHLSYGHFSNCLGFNREIVIAENYEAELGWFPLKWKSGIKPIRCALHNKHIQLPDYVFVFGNFDLLQNENNIHLKMFIDSACNNIYNSPDGLTKLFLVNKTKAE